MEWTGLNELREKYLAFFESKDHLRLPSFSLIPQGDKSLLLIPAGMAPMKKYFTGEVTPPKKRVTTCQKCIRTPDIERVGKTARHGTYFEMLGNFSFGDYFKKDATAWAWEFCTKVLEMPEDKLYVSIYEDDDEAYEIWTKQNGVDPSHMVRLGKEDNFWEHGEGPCGPCSEIYFDRGPEHGCGSPDCHVGCDCDRFVEFWNLVFTQFDSDGKGTYTPLANPNIDTGMGLERLACIMQGVDNLFEVDTVRNIMKHISTLTGVEYGANPKTAVSLRVITDHIRSTTFMVGDGVMPSNEGRGYVLRRLLRRAARHGRLLGMTEPFLYKVCETVISENLSAYPELKDKEDFIKKLIRNEEESFDKTIDSGLQLLNEQLATLKGDTLSGEDAFKLYDTYGFPLDLTVDILEEKGLKVDEKAFQEKMTEQRLRARNARKDAGADAWKGEAAVAEKLDATKFVGYTDISCEAKVIALVKDNQLVDAITLGEDAAVVLDASSFYGESGGQVGDVGEITCEGGTFEVVNTVKVGSGVLLHNGSLTQGDLHVGDVVTANVSKETRYATMRNHTAAHLLQAALRKILGTHVEQAGQLVDDKRMRFDFTHFSALTPEELSLVENQVNAWVLQGIETDIREMPIDEARKLGAMALFGEKYGDIVRVVSVPDVSVEFCGGTHVSNTAKLGLFHILSETSVAAGVRRIEAVTGTNVLEALQDEHKRLVETSQILKANGPEDVVRRSTQLMGEMKALKQDLEAAEGKLASAQLGDLFEKAEPVGNVRFIAAEFKGSTADAIRTMCDRCKDSLEPDMVVLLAGTNEKGVSFGCVVGKDAQTSGVNAGKIIKAAAMAAGGNGGGRPDSAMGAGKDIHAVEQAFEEAKKSL
ncbi:MAG: alanine--tRNA ligase [Clostridia bacterium]|nr:alanine--tRNA ligase [Clostridia bacterium]